MKITFRESIWFLKKRSKKIFVCDCSKWNSKNKWTIRWATTYGRCSCIISGFKKRAFVILQLLLCMCLWVCECLAGVVGVWGGLRVAVECPCPPIHKYIVTLHYLFYLTFFHIFQKSYASVFQTIFWPFWNSTCKNRKHIQSLQLWLIYSK